MEVSIVLFMLVMLIVAISMNERKLFIIDTESFNSSTLVRLLTNNGFDKLIVIRIIWDHPEIQFTCPPQHLWPHCSRMPENFNCRDHRRGSQFFSLEVEDDKSNGLMDLLVKNGFDKLAILPSVWDHPEIKYTCPPEHIRLSILDKIRRVGGQTVVVHSNGSNGNVSEQQLTIEEAATASTSHSSPDGLNSQLLDQLFSRETQEPKDVRTVADLFRDIKHEMDGSEINHDIMNGDIDLATVNSLKRKLSPSNLVRDGLLTKRQQEHPSLDKYACAKCKRKIGGRIHMFLIHVQTSHSQLKPYACTMCSFTSSKSAVALHMMQIHNNKQDPPTDIRSVESCNSWNQAIMECFPEFFTVTGCALSTNTESVDRSLDFI